MKLKVMFSKALAKRVLDVYLATKSYFHSMKWQNKDTVEFCGTWEYAFKAVFIFYWKFSVDWWW